MARVYLQNLPRLKAKLIKLKEQTAKDVKPVLGQGAEKIVQLMRSVVPVKSGKLQSSIGWTFGAPPKGSLAIASAKSGILRVTIYAGGGDAFYSRFVEFGTAPHIAGGKFEGAEHPGSAPRPFFFPSYRVMRKEVLRMLRKAIRDSVRKAVR